MRVLWSEYELQANALPVGKSTGVIDRSYTKLARMGFDLTLQKAAKKKGKKCARGLLLAQ